MTTVSVAMSMVKSSRTCPSFLAMALPSLPTVRPLPVSEQGGDAQGPVAVVEEIRL
ncbi:hypothetical protein [Microbacterium sp. LWH3-1.2]|uniref:hypothetical protein n=1 Tax=Microbacterium sp. LWH3-1.2 TaxID=3135256 RepID=UPI0034248F63